MTTLITVAKETKVILDCDHNGYAHTIAFDVKVTLTYIRAIPIKYIVSHCSKDPIFEVKNHYILKKQTNIHTYISFYLFII